MFSFLRRKKVKKFGEIAVEKGLLSDKQVEEALREQKEYLEKNNIHKKIGAILAEKGALSQEDIETVLQEQDRQMSLMAWFCALFGLNK
jgi:hypothetical protein